MQRCPHCDLNIHPKFKIGTYVLTPSGDRYKVKGYVFGRTAPRFSLKKSKQADSHWYQLQGKNKLDQHFAHEDNLTAITT